MNHRIPYFDNARFFLMILVVEGHALRPWLDASTVIRGIYVWIFLFHMPAFVAIAGYFSDPKPSLWRLKKNLRQVLLPYGIFQILYLAYVHVLFPSPWRWQEILQPYWLMWFLWCLFWWRIMLWGFARWRWSMLWACLLAVGAGYFKFTGWVPSLSKTLVFFPFFLGGALWRDKGWPTSFAPAVKVAAVLLLITAGGLAYRWNDFNYQWLYGSDPYEFLGFSGWTAGWTRTVYYLVSGTCVLAFLTLVPGLARKYTEWGSRSLYPYLWHGFFIKALLVSGFYSLAPDPLLGICLAGAGMILLVFLSSRRFQKWTRPLVQP